MNTVLLIYFIHPIPICIWISLPANCWFQYQFQFINPPRAETQVAWETRQIPWLLMPWLPASPSDQQPSLWMGTMGLFLSCLGVKFNNLWCFNEHWRIMSNAYFDISSEKMRTMITLASNRRPSKQINTLRDFLWHSVTLNIFFLI